MTVQWQSKIIVPLVLGLIFVMGFFFGNMTKSCPEFTRLLTKDELDMYGKTIAVEKAPTKQNLKQPDEDGIVYVDLSEVYRNIYQSINQSINPSVNQSINQKISRSINQSSLCIYYRKWWLSHPSLKPSTDICTNRFPAKKWPISSLPSFFSSSPSRHEWTGATPSARPGASSSNPNVDCDWFSSWAWSKATRKAEWLTKNFRPIWTRKRKSIKTSCNSGKLSTGVGRWRGKRRWLLTGSCGSVPARNILQRERIIRGSIRPNWWDSSENTSRNSFLDIAFTKVINQSNKRSINRLSSVVRFQSINQSNDRSTGSVLQSVSSQSINQTIDQQAQFHSLFPVNQWLNRPVECGLKFCISQSTNQSISNCMMLKRGFLRWFFLQEVQCSGILKATFTYLGMILKRIHILR